VDVLITSPSFLNLLVISGVWDRFNLLSLKHINYGSEVMSQHLLIRLSELSPNIKLSQSYGMSELGVLKTKSKNSHSLAIKISDVNSKYRIVDGKLEIKSNTSMLGYLNAPTPFTLDGWLKTGDMVEVSADGWLKILGRESDIINIGGMKVFPIEIENAILQMPGIKDVVVYAEPNAILGNIIKAQILMESNLPKDEKIKLLRKYCFDNLDGYKVPQKFEFIDQVSHCRRHKKLRNFNYQMEKTNETTTTI
jgi:acyl-CoA synthetase (AMP-forming)/AMP-acid ligase II